MLYKTMALIFIYYSSSNLLLIFLEIPSNTQQRSCGKRTDGVRGRPTKDSISPVFYYGVLLF